MAFDGITIANIVYDLNRTILNGRIAKIAQPEKDELILTIKGGNVGQARLLLSASASLPLIYLTFGIRVTLLVKLLLCQILKAVFLISRTLI